MIEKFNNFKIITCHSIYGGGSFDHQDNDGIPPDEADRSDWDVYGG